MKRYVPLSSPDRSTVHATERLRGYKHAKTKTAFFNSDVLDVVSIPGLGLKSPCSSSSVVGCMSSGEYLDRVCRLLLLLRTMTVTERVRIEIDAQAARIPASSTLCGHHGSVYSIF